MLDRVGGELARATSIVRYAPGSHFPQHLHPGGEEILVLNGIFSEGTHNYPAGWYLRNPPGSSHQPFSKLGTQIFVKLSQMNIQECLPTRINTNDLSKWFQSEGKSMCLLYDDPTESTYLMKLSSGISLRQDNTRHVELLIINGELQIQDTELPAGSWLRLPRGKLMHLKAGMNGAMIYIKMSNIAGNT